MELLLSNNEINQQEPHKAGHLAGCASSMEFSPKVKVGPSKQPSHRIRTHRGWRCPERVFPSVKISWVCYVKNVTCIYVFPWNHNVLNKNTFPNYSSFSCSNLLAIPVFLGNTDSFIPILITNISSLITYCSSRSKYLSVCIYSMYLGYRMAAKD